MRKLLAQVHLLFYLLIGVNPQSERPQNYTPPDWDESLIEDEDTSTPRGLQGRIHGGTDAFLSEVPYHVMIVYQNNHKCSGAITIAATGEQVVVTTAQCVMYPMQASNTTLPAVSLTVIAGRRFRSEPYRGEQIRKVRRVRYHRGLWRTSYENDFAVLFLVEPFKVTVNVQPVKLPVKNWPASRYYTISGWGKTADNSTLVEELQVARVEYFNHEECYNKYYSYHYQWAVFSSSLCLWGQGKVTSCEGDQGAPAVGLSRGEPYLAGIYQWKHGKCGDEWPGIYADMQHFGEQFVDIVATEDDTKTPDGYGRRK